MKHDYHRLTGRDVLRHPRRRLNFTGLTLILLAFTVITLVLLVTRNP